MNDSEFISVVEKCQIFHPMYFGHARSCQFTPTKKERIKM